MVYVQLQLISFLWFWKNPNKLLIQRQYTLRGREFNLHHYIKNFLDKSSIEVMIYGKNEFFQNYKSMKNFINNLTRVIKNQIFSVQVFLKLLNTFTF